MNSIFALAFKNLFRNFRRTMASLITVAFGAAGLLIYQGFNEGIMNQYRENTIRVRYGHGQVFPKGYHGKVLEKPWEAWIANPQDVESELVKIKDIKMVFPRLSFYSFLTKGGISLAGRGEGILPERESKFFTAMNFESGKDISDSQEIILGKGLANSLNAKVGDNVTLLAQTVNGQLNGADLKVAGIFHTGSQEFDNSFFRVPLVVAQNLLDTQKVEHFAVETSGVEVWPNVQNEIQKNNNLEAISFDELDAVYYKNAVNFLDSQFQFIRLIILAIVALGIFNVVAVGLLERASEVGALRANGEPKIRILKIFMTESFWLGIMGGLLGVVVATVLDKTILSHGIPMPPGPGITRSFLIFLEIQPKHYLQALALPAIATVLASLWPISQILKKTIPQLLRAT